jgi:integrase
MRVHLKGLNSATKRLADGTSRTYHYAWRGGPPLRGEPGTPEFMASYNEAVGRKLPLPTCTLLSVLQAYQSSEDFSGLAPRTKQDYVRHLTLIERKFGTFPLAALSDRRSRGDFLAWRDEMGRSSRRQADYVFATLGCILAWAMNRGLITDNPCEKAGKLYQGTRNDKVWTHDDEANFLRRAPAHMHLPLLLALWTGQRQGDLLRLPWSAYDGERIRLRQSKGGRRVAILVGAPLKVALDAAAKTKTCPLILTTSEGKPWQSGGFRSSWRRACAKAGVVGVTFHDLRGTAVTRFALAGSTEAEIAYNTGHSLRDVRAVLDRHYLHRDPALGESAIRKLEAAVSKNKGVTKASN